MNKHSAFSLLASFIVVMLSIMSVPSGLAKQSTTIGSLKQTAMMTTSAPYREVGETIDAQHAVVARLSTANAIKTPAGDPPIFFDPTVTPVPTEKAAKKQYPARIQRLVDQDSQTECDEIGW